MFVVAWSPFWNDRDGAAAVLGFSGGATDGIARNAVDVELSPSGRARARVIVGALVDNAIEVAVRIDNVERAVAMVREDDRRVEPIVARVGRGIGVVRDLDDVARAAR